MPLGLIPSVWATPEEARKAFESGNAALARADFDAAVTAYEVALRGDEKNEQYIQVLAVVRQIRDLREQLPQERDLMRWRQSAAALHAFYADHGLYGESLPIDQERFRRVPSGESAVLLAGTLLALSRDHEAADLLAGLNETQRTPHVKALHGLALMRLGNPAVAKEQLVDPALLPADSGADCFLDTARLAAAVGRNREALAALKRCLELSHPNRIEIQRQRAQSLPEFVAMKDSTAFTEVLATPSTIRESGCSGGSACGSCPKRAQCSGAAAAEKKD